MDMVSDIIQSIANILQHFIKIRMINRMEDNLEIAQLIKILKTVIKVRRKKVWKVLEALKISIYYVNKEN
jgi:hypothetical protein